jgi:hypothetical protein
MSYGEGDQEKMDKICAIQGWPQVPFPAYVMVNAIVNGQPVLEKVRCMVEATYRDYPRDASGRPLGDLVDTFAKVRLEEPMQGVKRGQTIEVLRLHHTKVEPVGPLDLMVEGSSI